MNPLTIARRPLVVARVVTLLVSGCRHTRDAPMEGSPVFSDSLGVSVVTSSHALSQDTSGWHVSERPLLRVETTAEHDDVVVHWIRGAARMSDGRIALVSESARQVMFLSPDGKLLGTSGREGDGPGEFRAPFALTRLAGDTLVVADRRSFRLTWLDPEGHFVRQFAPAERLQSVVPERQFPGMPQYFARGYVVAETHQSGLSRPGERTRTPMGYAVMGPSGKPRYLGGFLDLEQFYESERNGRFAFFANRTLMAIGLAPPTLYVGETDPFEIKAFAPSGALVRIIRDRLAPTAITDRDISWERWELLDWAERSGRMEDLTRLADAMPIPDHKPAFEALIVDSEGYLWAKEYSSYEPGPARYRIYAPTGERVGVALLPGRLQVFDIGTDYVLGDEWDLDYVETVKMYRLERPSGHDGPRL